MLKKQLLACIEICGVFFIVPLLCLKKSRFDVAMCSKLKPALLKQKTSLNPRRKTIIKKAKQHL